MKKYGMLFVLVIMLGAAGLVMLGHRDDRADLSAVMELVGDAQQDALKTGHVLLQLSDEEENKLGREVVSRFGFGLNEAPHLASYVTAVARPLLAHIQRPGINYTFRVLDNDQANAFALPGGQIFVFRGLLDCVDSEAELASIIGHEISHVDLRHCVELFLIQVRLESLAGRSFPRNPAELLLRLPANLTVLTHQVIKAGYRKFQEFDADAGGMNLIANAGYLPSASIAAMQRLQDKLGGGPTKKPTADNPAEELAKATLSAAGGYFRSHPPLDERIERLKRKGSSLAPTGYRGKENLRHRIARANQEFPDER